MMQTKFVALLALRILLVSTSEADQCTDSETCVDTAHVSLLQEAMHVTSSKVEHKTKWDEEQLEVAPAYGLDDKEVPVATKSGEDAVEWVHQEAAPSVAAPCGEARAPCGEAPCGEAPCGAAPSVAAPAPAAAQQASVPWLVWAMLVFTAIVMLILLLQMCLVTKKKEPEESFVEPVKEIRREVVYAPQGDYRTTNQMYAPQAPVRVPEVMTIPPTTMSRLPVPQVTAPVITSFVTAPVSTVAAPVPIATIGSPRILNTESVLSAAPPVPIAVGSGSFRTSPVLMPASMGPVQSASMTMSSLPPTAGRF
jgi:hypothetical protein